jgi:CheY-like chemotaxis protein
MRNAVGALRILLSGSGSGARATAAIVLNDLAAMWDFAYGNIRCLPIPLEAPCRSNACGRNTVCRSSSAFPLRGATNWEKMDQVRTEFGVGRSRVPAASAGNRESLLSANAKVLVVEDDPANQEALCALLRVMGYTATAADGGTEALRLLHTPMDLDLIISDVVMPGMSGIDFAKRARIARPGMPIVLVTGDAYAVDAVLASGSIALLKPYTSETLQRVLSETLANGSGYR